jgi:hypothetical protein
MLGSRASTREGEGMNLASVAAKPSGDPVYIGLRVSDDREFSAPEYAAGVRPLAAKTQAAAADEAQQLLKGGAFDAAKSVAVLTGTTGGFEAGSVVELPQFGGAVPISVNLKDPHFDYWFEKNVVGVVDRSATNVIERP